ncbi:MAG: insulinase family protein [Gammaproteobacteria bacterium]|nr:insulinase family protein [Gammaproteobacteria bacterium]
MKKLIAGLLTGLIVVACSKTPEPAAESTPAAASDSALTRSDGIFDLPYLMRDLDNGLRVIVVPTDYPDIFTIQIPVQTGSRNEVEPGKSGFAHFFEHMMFRGTEKYPAEVYSDILKKAGADQNAYTTDDYTNYYITATVDDLEKIIELEADRFMNLSYSEPDFRTEALAVKGEYLKNFSNPTQKAYERIRAMAFRDHTYRHTTMGFIEDIEAMPDQLDYSRTFFDRWYRPEKTAVIIVGDVDAEATFDLVEKYWGEWEAGDYTVDVPDEPPASGPLYEHIAWEGPTQPWLIMAFRGPAYDPTEKDMPAMDLLSSIYFSDSSELYRKLVLEDQSVDQLSTYFPDRTDPNLLMIFARLTDAAHGADVEQAINATLVEARTQHVNPQKVEETKSRLRYQFTSQLDSASGIGRMLAAFVHFDRTPETVNEVYDTYASLTAEDIRHHANQYFTDAKRVMVTLSNDTSMAGVGEATPIDELVAVAEVDAPSPGNAAVQTGDKVKAFAIEGDALPVSIVAQQSDSSPLVDVAFLVHAGAAMDPPGKKGLAMLTAMMLTDGGSTSMSIQEINEALYPIAAGFNAQVDKEMTRLSGQVHKDNLDTWYGLTRDQLLNPGWDQSDLERLKTQLKNAVRTGLVGNNDEELGKEVLYADIYAGHPYGSLNAGHTDDIASLTMDDVKRFYEQHYTINNMTVGLAGGYPDEFAKLVSNDLQKLPAGERNVLELPAVAALGQSRVTIVEKETPAVAVSFGFPIELTRGDPDWAALWLARSYLGEHRSTNGHLFKRIRKERGMNYGDYAYIEYFPNGMFRFHPDTNLARQQQIFQVWIRPLRSNNDAHFATRTAVYELNKLVEEGMSESDFEATRSYLSKFVSLLTDGQSRQLGYAIDSQFYEIGNFSEYVRDALDELTLADVNRVIRENLRTDNMSYVFVTRDAADLRERLESDQPSPISYDAEKPAELLAEDREIEELPLGFATGSVTIVASDNVFK